jgi:hypothetical protein
MPDIMDSEAGIMLVAERMSVLSNRSILKLVLILSQRGPLTLEEIKRAGLGKVNKVISYLKFLESEGVVVRVRRRFTAGPPGRKKNKTFYHYFCCDEFVPTALMETITLIKRGHRTKAEACTQLERDLRLDDRLAFPDIDTGGF